QTGFPTTKDEDWRFTNVNAVSQASFHVLPAACQHIAPSDLEQFRLPGATGRLVFVNGRLAPALSESGTLPKGVKVGGLAEEIEQNPAALEGHLGRYIKFGRDGFSALNTAFIEDGAYVYLPRRAVVEAPIHLLFVSAADGRQAMAHPHTLIVAEDETQV